MLTSKAMPSYPIYACVFHIMIHFRSIQLVLADQRKDFENMTQCIKLMSI